MKVAFYPALGEGAFLWPYQLQEGSFLEWEWSDILISYPYWWQSRHIPPEHMNVFGDSGGFTVVTKGAAIDPVHALSWQMRFCDAGTILDIPPYETKGSQQFAGVAAERLKSALERTRRNVTQALPVYLQAKRAQRKFRWFGVVQGETFDEMQAWFAGVSDIYPFDDEGEGWALAPKPSTNVFSLARHLRFAKERGLKRIHVLQISNYKSVAVLLYLARLAGIESLSFDSAAASLFSANHKLIVRDGLLRYNHIADGVHEYLMSGKCSCYGCVWYQESLDVPRQKRPRYMMLHNHLTLLEVFGRLQQASEQDGDLLLRNLIGERTGEVMRVFRGEDSISRFKSVSVLDRLKGVAS